MQPFDEPSPLEPTVLGAAWRYKWLVLALTIAGAAIAYLLAASSAVTEYEATASMVVEDPRSSILFDVGSRQRRQDYIADQIEILQSGAVAALAVDIANQTPGVDLTPGELLSNVRVIGSEDSSLIFVQVRLDEPDDAVAAASAMIEAYKQFLRDEIVASFASSIEVLDETITSLQQELFNTRARIRELTQGGDPDRVRLLAQADEAVARLADLLERLPDASGESRDELRAQINDVLLEFNAVRTAQSLAEDDPEVDELLQTQSRLLQRIDDLAERRDRIRLDSQLLSSGVTASIPAFAAEPVETSISRTVAVGGILGLLAAAALAYALALRKRNFTDRSQPEFILGAPLIAEIPTFRQEGIKSALPVETDPASASAEAFRFAAAALDLTRTGNRDTLLARGKSVAVVSAGTGEGKTVIAANTALAAAREGSKVLLIDADFGNQVATELLAPGVRPSAGITEVVEGGVPLADAVITVESGPNSGLHVLARGWRKTTGPEFFRLPATRAFIQQVQDYYDLVLIDTPPLLHVAYASTIADIADKVLVVVPHDSPAAPLEELKDRLDLIGSPIVGYIYNLAPLRLEFTRSEGSMKDILGVADGGPSGAAAS